MKFIDIGTVKHSVSKNFTLGNNHSPIYAVSSATMYLLWLTLVKGIFSGVEGTVKTRIEIEPLQNLGVFHNYLLVKI